MPFGAETALLELSKEALALLYVHLFNKDVLVDEQTKKKYNITDTLTKEYYGILHDYSMAIKANSQTITEIVLNQNEKDDFCQYSCKRDTCIGCFLLNPALEEIGDEIISMIDLSLGNLVYGVFELLKFYAFNKKNPNKNEEILVPPYLEN